MEGKVYAIGGRDFVVPRLRVGAYERAMNAVFRADKIQNDDSGVGRLNAYAEALVELLKEGQPDLTAQAVKDLLFMDELDSAFAGVLAAAGKRMAAPGEAGSP